MIKRTVVYETKGKQFPTVAKAVEYREGLIEAFLRGIPGFQDIPMRQKIPFVQYVLDNRAALSELLNYDLEDCDDSDT